jgi:hypothetical protein
VHNVPELPTQLSNSIAAELDQSQSSRRSFPAPNTLSQQNSDGYDEHSRSNPTASFGDSWETNLFDGDGLWANLPTFSGFGTDTQIYDGDFLGSETVGNAACAVLSMDQDCTDLFEDFSSNASTSVPIDMKATEKSLLKHFVDFAVPPLLVGVESRWNSARKALVKLTKGNHIIRHAICAFAALSLTSSSEHANAAINTHYSTHFYQLALHELDTFLELQPRSHLDPQSAENVLAAIFFLTYVELMTTSTPQNSLKLLHQAYNMTSREEIPRTALVVQLQSWLKLLDAKVVSAGGDGFHLLLTPHLFDQEDPSRSSRKQTPLEGEADNSVQEVEDIIFKTLNTPAYNFYLEVIPFSGRIARLDPWHRSRGSVSDEFEVMTAGQTIVNDLEALWKRRPETIDLLDQYDKLRLCLSDVLASKLQEHLWTYCANFYACYIHLQRVAYAHLPATKQAEQSVREIIRIVRLAEQRQKELPSSMLWPLMMAGCEAEAVNIREWIITKIETMSSKIGNASRTAKLVQEITKRQVASGKRFDARSVMHEAFGTIFAIM